METKYPLTQKLNNYGHPYHEIMNMCLSVSPKISKKERLTREMAQWIRDSSSDPRTYIKAKLCITASCNAGTQEAETTMPQQPG